MEDLSLFARHLAGAMGARAPLPDILRAYVHDSESSPLRRAIERMIPEIEKGVSIAEAMDGFPGVFPAAFRKLVRLGEQAHTLPGLMRQTADRLEEGLKVYERFRRAAVYPLCVLSILFVLIGFLTWKIAPKMEEVFEQLGMNVREITMLGVTPSQSMQAMMILLMLPTLYLLAVFLGLRVWGFGQGKLVLQLPLIGPILRQAESANFANYLSLLLHNRVPLAEALGLLSDATTNSYVQAAIEDFHRRFQAGEPLGSMIQHQPLFPSSMAVMIAAAEDQGELADTLRHLGRFYQDRTLHGLSVLHEMVEPILLLATGFVIFLVTASVYLPLFEIPSMIH
jgi:type II secretory pathway component PulF